MEVRIERRIHEWAEEQGHQVDLSAAVSLSGGSVNEAWRIICNGEEAFLKIARTSLPGMFREEARGLETLRSAGEAFRIPEIYHADDQFLLLEYIPGRNTTAADDASAGAALAEMHRIEQDGFGFSSDNYIATLKQRNTREETWSTFFIEHRLRPLLMVSGAVGEEQIEHVLKNVTIYIRYKMPIEHPVLLHGDLWSGNRMTDQCGRPVLVDPAVYCGHREMDIGMTTLFGGFGSSFYEAYQEVWPLEAGWQERMLLCNLYPLLVHEHLFGLSYRAAVRTNLVELGLLK